MFHQTLQQIGSAAENHARISMVSDDSYSSFLRTIVEEKLYYLKDITAADEFDDIVSTELRGMSTVNSEKPKNLETFNERVRAKVVTRLAKFKTLSRRNSKVPEKAFE
jgi:hypothetical protein